MNATADRIPDYLRHIMEAAEKIEKYTAGLSLADFLDNDMCRDAVVRQIEIIGEASSRIRDARGGQKLAGPWGEAIKMRNRVIHVYDGVNAEIVWETVQNDIPELKKLAGDELKQLVG